LFGEMPDARPEIQRKCFCHWFRLERNSWARSISVQNEIKILHGPVDAYQELFWNSNTISIGHPFLQRQ
jgi:hypothetical protein